MTALPSPSGARLVARDAVFIAVGFGSGTLAAVAIAMVGAVGRQRGGEEATWLHILILVTAMTVVAGVAALRGSRPQFERPLHTPAAVAVLGAACGALALATARGLEWYYLLSGVISTGYFVLATWLLVRVSLALFFASTTLGTVFGSLVLDQLGAFGAPEHDLSPIRVMGAVLVAAGVVWIRTGK